MICDPLAPPPLTRKRNPRHPLPEMAGGFVLAVLCGGILPAQQNLAPSVTAGPPEPSVRASGSFATGHYRNLFTQMLGRRQAEVTGKVNAAFHQLFYGAPDTQAVFFPAGKNSNGALAYIWDAAHNEVRSEWMSFGMMIAVQLDKKAEFDALWNWARTFMYHEAPAHPARGFFSWSMKTDGTPNDEMPTPVAEEYFTMSLYFAAGRWGNGAGIYDYKAEADRLLSDMRHRELITGPTVRGARTAGELFHPDYAMVFASPTIESRGFTDPSYQLPAFYELWARWGPVADRPFWAKAALASREFFRRATHPITALTPDYANFGGPPWAAAWDNQSVYFRFDAWRSVMNWSVDWAWWALDPQERQLSDRLLAFFESRGVSDYGNQYTLDGRQISGAHSIGLVAMNAVAGLSATDPRARRFVKALWDAPIPSGRWRYYDGMLYLVGLLHCSGGFRIWAPAGLPQPAEGGRPR